MNRNVTPCALQVADAVEEPVDRGAVELGGRLVEDDEPGAEGQRPGDLDELPLLDGRGRRPACCGVDVDRPGRQQLLCPAAQRRQLISRPRPRSCRLRKRFSATVSVGDDRRLLVDAGHPLPPGVAVGEPRAPAAPPKVTVPSSGACSPVRIGHQGRLAGSVAADERVRLAGPDR